MTYRPSEALCHWRHLAIVCPEMNIAEIPAADHPALWPGAITSNVLAGIRQFSKDVIDFSNGQCWMQTDIVVVPEEWTVGRLHPSWGPTAGVVDPDDAAEGAAALLGCRTDCYDSYSFYGPTLGFIPGGFSGLSYHAFTGMGYYIIPAGLSDASNTISSIEITSIHEWCHGMDFYYEDLPGNPPFPHPDSADSLCVHLDGSPFTDTLDVCRASLSGDIMDIATETPQGCTAEVWALGPPRKNFPR